MENVREPAVADMFYSGDEDTLKRMILEYLEKVPAIEIAGKVKAVIAPHAGYIYSGQTAAYSYKLLKALDPDVRWKILLLGLSHHVPISGAAAPAFEKWKTPLGEVVVKDVRDEIGKSDLISDIPDAGIEEHSLEVQVPFLQMVLKGGFDLYPLVLGSFRAELLAEELAEFCARDDVITVVSSDLSHYLPYEEAKKVDHVTCKAVCDLDAPGMESDGDACGKMGILTLIHLAKKLNWKCKILDYKNSGDTAGTKDKVVGYGSWGFLK
jgi:MEMO1 family protein